MVGNVKSVGLGTTMMSTESYVSNAQIKTHSLPLVTKMEKLSLVNQVSSSQLLELVVQT